MALSDSAGDTVQTYEYSVYGRVAASDPDFLTNPYMFTGRRFDFETGLYYYRARYYNPYIGRFMQTDPVGYGAGINWYLYCWNNPLSWVDSYGFEPTRPDGSNKWNRENTHPISPYNFPYYIQHYGMDCVPVAILNWWWTYDEGLPTKSFLGIKNRVYDTDLEAEEYVQDLVDSRAHDWDVEGVNNFDYVGQTAGHVSEFHYTAPTVDEIIKKVKDGHAVMIGIDVNRSNPRRQPNGDYVFEGDPQWHCVLVAPTPLDYTNSDVLKYSVIDAVSPMPMIYTKENFKKWFNNLPGVYGQWLVGDIVEGHGSD